MYGEFLPNIPGLLNWVLEMDEKSATSIVKNYEANVPSLLAMKARTLVETNPIADWLDNFVVYEREAKTNIGVAKRDKDSNSPFWYLNTAQWLYPNYCEYCHNSGTKPVSLRRFVSLLSDLGNNQLGLDINRERDRSGSYFVGLKIKDAKDDSPPMITGNTEVLKDTASHIVINVDPQPKNTNVIKELWTMAMNKVMDVMDSVMDESIADDRCDECVLKDTASHNGKNEKRNKTKNKIETLVECNTSNELKKEKKDSLDKVSNVPSPPSPHEPQTQAGKEVTVVMDNSSKPSPTKESTISVGDRVEVENCPGHWSWAIPFTVEAIDGKMAKLEMVEELVEIERLESVDG